MLNKLLNGIILRIGPLAYLLKNACLESEFCVIAASAVVDFYLSQQCIVSVVCVFSAAVRFHECWGIFVHPICQSASHVGGHCVSKSTTLIEPQPYPHTCVSCVSYAKE